MATVIDRIHAAVVRPRALPEGISAFDSNGISRWRQETNPGPSEIMPNGAFYGIAAGMLGFAISTIAKFVGNEISEKIVSAGNIVGTGGLGIAFGLLINARRNQIISKPQETKPRKEQNPATTTDKTEDSERNSGLSYAIGGRLSDDYLKKSHLN